MKCLPNWGLRLMEKIISLEEWMGKRGTISRKYSFNKNIYFFFNGANPPE
jgi:hypothetical protein